MSNTIIKAISALILAFVIFINAIGNFIGIGDIINTEPATTEVQTTQAQPTVATDTDAKPTTTKPTTTEVEVTADIGERPQSKEEIVLYFNTVINRAKRDSESITSNYMKHNVAGEITGIPSVLDSIAESLIKDNMGEDEDKKNVTWSTEEDKNSNFPVEGESWASKLTAADVKEATITEKNGKYVITITTVEDEKSSEYVHGTGHAPKAFNVVLPDIIDGYMPGVVKSLFSVGSISMAYPSSTIQVTVDAATGRVLTANYMMYWTLYIPLGDTETALPFSTEGDYTINW